MEILNQITGWFDIIWFWSGRAVGGVFLLALALAMILTVLEYIWPKIEAACKFIKKAIQEVRWIADYIKWKREDR